MLIYSFLAVGIGAALGGWLRWGLGLWLNPALPELPLHYPGLSPEWRLLIITGFLGGLTTFSTFSAETVTLLLRGQYAWGSAVIFTHLGGSLLMTVLGIQTFKWLHS
jgi:fluoride exporter